MKTTEEKMAVMQAHLEGKPIEWAHSGFLHGKWVVTQFPYWDWVNYDYRVAVTKPSINWDHVHPDFNWLATDMDHTSYLYTSEPYTRNAEWQADSARVIPGNPFASFKEGTCDWKDSLVKRPEK